MDSELRRRLTLAEAAQPEIPRVDAYAVKLWVSLRSGSGWMGLPPSARRILHHHESLSVERNVVVRMRTACRVDPLVWVVWAV